MRSMPSTPRGEVSFSGVMGSAIAAARLGAVQALAAWPVLFGRVVFYLLILVVLSALWDKVLAEQVTPLAGMLPSGGLAIYIGVTEWVTLSVVAIQQRLEDDIRSGGLEPYLLRPKSYLLQRVAPAMGETMVRLVALGAAGLAAIAISGRPLPIPSAWPALLLLGSLGCVLGTLLYVLVGLAAFWMRRVMPAMLIVQKLSFLLGGLVAPISLYPDWLFGFAKATPFGAHLYWVGVQALTPSVRMFWIGVGWQILWSVLLSALCVIVWRAGLRKALREGL
jgi:viologen exporter family transport system permease protein